MSDVIDREDVREKELNKDPITGQAGAHPLGTGIGGVTGAASGALFGAVFGPLGALIGGSVGAIVGGAAGKSVAESIDPSYEEAYWRENHRDTTYYNDKYDFDNDYSPAYHYGVNARTNTYRDQGKWNDTIENNLSNDWEKNRGDSKLSWDEARPAVKDAYDKVDNNISIYEQVDDKYQDSYQSMSYYNGKNDYASGYGEAYRYGALVKSKNQNKDWDDEVEQALENHWNESSTDKSLAWDDAKPAIKDSWDNYTPRS